MRGLFSIDGKVYRFLEKVADCIIVSILWILFSLPIFTIGAATTAMYYTVYKTVQNGVGHVFKTFWVVFKSNFKQATLLWGIMLLILAILGVDCYFSYVLSDLHPDLKWLLLILFALVAFGVMWSQYIFSYIAHIADPIKVVLKNTFTMCILHFSKSLLMLIAMVACLFFIISLPIGVAFVIILPGAYTYFACIMLKKVFSHYWDIEYHIEE